MAWTNSRSSAGLAVAVENYLTSYNAYHKQNWLSLILSYLIVGLDDQTLGSGCLDAQINCINNMDTASTPESTNLFAKITSSGKFNASFRK